jgi:hypothetical protein
MDIDPFADTNGHESHNIFREIGVSFGASLS